MMEVLITLGLSLVSGFSGWFFGRAKYQAETRGVERTNDRSEIENLNLIAKEWKEAAMLWKAMADEYQSKAIENMKRIADMEHELHSLRLVVQKQQKQITKLQKDLENDKGKDHNTL